MIVYNAYGAPVTLGAEIARGSRAIFYKLPGQPGKVAKLYHSYHEAYEAKLRWMIAHPPATQESPVSVPAIAWPLALLYNAKASFVGYVLSEIPQASTFRHLLAPTDQAQARPGLRDRRGWRAPGPIDQAQARPGLRRLHLHQIGHQLAAAMQRLHEAGYVAGTLHPGQLLVTPPDAVTLIDTDSFQVKRAHLAEITCDRTLAWERAYLAPELQEASPDETILTPQQDHFALAVLLFQLLMQGHHPFEAQWCGVGTEPSLAERIATGLYPYAATPLGPVIPPHYAPRLEWLSPRLMTLFERAFVEGHQTPAKRPWSAEWQEAFRETLLAFRPCLQGHSYDSHLPTCPYCAAQLAPPAPPPKAAAVDPSNGSPPADIRTDVPAEPIDLRTPSDDSEFIREVVLQVLLIYLGLGAASLLVWLLYVLRER